MRWGDRARRSLSGHLHQSATTARCGHLPCVLLSGVQGKHKGLKPQQAFARQSVLWCCGISPPGVSCTPSWAGTGVWSLWVPAAQGSLWFCVPLTPCGNWIRQHQHWSKSLGSGLQDQAIPGAVYYYAFLPLTVFTVYYKIYVWCLIWHFYSVLHLLKTQVTQLPVKHLYDCFRHLGSVRGWTDPELCGGTWRPLRPCHAAA